MNKLTDGTKLNWLRHHWWVIALVLSILAGLETSEFKLGISDTFHLGEIMIYVVLLSVVGLLVEMVLRSNRTQQNTMDLLKYKHQLSLEMMPYQNWDTLTNMLAKSLAEMLDAQAVNLSMFDALSQTYEATAEWTAEATTTNLPTLGYCQTCLQRHSVGNPEPRHCDLLAEQRLKEGPQVYCFPLFYRDMPYVLIRFVLKPGLVLKDQHRKMLSSVSDEVIVALMAALDRKRLSELELAKATLAERQAMSHYLHDNLGQNLGYLRMKLEQFIAQPVSTIREEDAQNDLMRMKDVAEQSYQIVRNKLEVSIPDSTPLLTNYLHEHAKKVSQRSKLEINFISQGNTKPVSVDLQRALFYVFQEALSNAEKHAQANKVDVLLDWDGDNVSITIKDNGKGFNIVSVSKEKHFGLEIMQERMSAVGGKVEVCSVENSGTSIKITAPIQFNKKQVVAVHG